MTVKITSAIFAVCATSREGMPNDGKPIIALVGRSNVGKSSLINALANRRELAKTSSLPGKTLTINFYLINDEFYIVDLPGYGYAKASKVTRARIQEMMDDFFSEDSGLKGVIQILDIRHSPTTLDKQMYQWIKNEKIPYMAVLTKADKLSNQQVQKALKNILNDLNLPGVLVFSAKNSQGKDELLESMKQLISGKDVVGSSKKPAQKKHHPGKKPGQPDNAQQRGADQQSGKKLENTDQQGKPAPARVSSGSPQKEQPPAGQSPQSDQPSQNRPRRRRNRKKPGVGEPAGRGSAQEKPAIE